MKTLARLFSRFETMMTAATFAEAGEFETAREIMRQGEEHRTPTTKRRDTRAGMRAGAGQRK